MADGRTGRTNIYKSYSNYIVVRIYTNKYMIYYRIAVSNISRICVLGPSMKLYRAQPILPIIISRYIETLNYADI